MKQIRSILIFSMGLIFAASCTSEKEPLAVVSECNSNLSLSSATEVNSNCGQSDGAFTVNVAGGSGSYTYQLGTSAAQTSPVFEGLAAGVYTVTVVDSDSGCTEQIELQVRNDDGVNATFTTSASDCNSPSGMIALTATDGLAPYEYKVGDGNFQADATFTALSPGAYDVTVRDANGCEVELQAEVASTVVFGEIRSLVQTNCAVSGCHNGTISPDFRVDANITGRASRILSRTSARTMPPQSSGRSLSNEEIADIVCWVNDGASGN